MGTLSCVEWLGMTRLHDLAARFARGLLSNFLTLQTEGAGMPGARCTRGLVCNRHKKMRTRAYRAAEASDIPCAMVLRLMSCSPRRTGLVVTVAGGIASTNLTPASGRQDHTILPYASLPFVKGTSASTASHPASVTIAKRPSYRDGTKSIYF